MKSKAEVFWDKLYKCAENTRNLRVATDCAISRRFEETAVPSYEIGIGKTSERREKITRGG